MTLPSHGGGGVSLSQFKGKQAVVLYFYPNDDTPGCTAEACEFRDAHAKLKAAGAVVLGVSPNSVASHEKFAAKFKLPFPLLADEEHNLAGAFGVWVKKKMFGHEFMGVQRSTVLIGKDGLIKKIWPKVRPAGHAAQVLAALKEL